MTEAELQSAVVDCAHLFGWRVAHFRPAMTKHGWRTPVSADGKGWPDLLMARGPWLVAAELKSDSGRLSDEQAEWLEALEKAGAETHLWRPRHWLSGEIERDLR